MKETIYTIPVIDGFNAGTECPFCAMTVKLDDEAVEAMLGSSYMEDDIRNKTNLQGFCQKHVEKMFKGQNALGLALMLHTHIMAMNAALEKQQNGGKKGYAQIAKHTASVVDSCYICDKIAKPFARYVDTFFMLWAKDASMRERVRCGKGFCFSHFALLLETSRKKLFGKAGEEFCQVITAVQLENMKRVEGDLDWFIKKFDYRYREEPWKSAKDAVARSLVKTASLMTAAGFEPGGTEREV